MTDDIAIGDGTGCSYHEHKGSLPCNKMCDAGETLCPHHLLLVKTKAESTEDKARAKAHAQAPARKHRVPRGYEQ